MKLQCDIKPHHDRVQIHAFRPVGQLIVRTCYGPTPYTDDINPFRPLKLSEHCQT